VHRSNILVGYLPKECKNAPKDKFAVLFFADKDGKKPMCLRHSITNWFPLKALPESTQPAAQALAEELRKQGLEDEVALYKEEEKRFSWKSLKEKGKGKEKEAQEAQGASEPEEETPRQKSKAKRRKPLADVEVSGSEESGSEEEAEETGPGEETDVLDLQHAADAFVDGRKGDDEQEHKPEEDAQPQEAAETRTQVETDVAQEPQPVQTEPVAAPAPTEEPKPAPAVSPQEAPQTPSKRGRKRARRDDIDLSNIITEERPNKGKRGDDAEKKHGK